MEGFNLDSIVGVLTKACTGTPQNCSRLFDNYREMVKKDPHIWKMAEQLLSSSSYLATSRLPIEIVELLFMSSNILRYFNDKILNAKPPRADVDPDFLEVDREKLEQMLQIVNCVEVFVELSARRLGGNPLKWLIVLLVTIVKTSIRICLMFKHNRVLIGSFTGDDTPRGWVGARSGVYFTQSHPNTNTPHPVPEKELIVAELCYTLRPLLHLATLALFRSKSWVPLIVSAGLEAYSIKSLARLKHPTERQCNEMSRRKVSMLLYLLRSPFYNELTEQRLLPVVDYISKIPVLGLLTDGLAGYIPDWQKIYFYSWTS